MNHLLQQWGESAYTSLGFFWMALWAFILGYSISAMIQIFITERRMQKWMGKENWKSVLLGTFFGFISSSCSFSALATSKSLFHKGASFISALAFLLASTNLVIELGIIISIFLGWQFVVGEYVGGILLILLSWLLIRLIRPKQLIQQARENLKQSNEHSIPEQKPLLSRMKSTENWSKVGRQYGMEWKMVWKDVTIGFTIAGIVASFVPEAFFQSLFIDAGEGQTNFNFFTLLEHAIIGPVAAFFTFIGSMGNIPLAALLFDKGVSFAGVMAFIFSDLVVFPVLRIHAKYYGWKMSFFILGLLFVSLVVSSILLHYGLDWLDLLPEHSANSIVESQHFQLDPTFFMNLIFLGLTGLLVYLGSKNKPDEHHHKGMAPKSPLFEKVVSWITFMCLTWLLIGILIKLFV